MRRGWQTFWYAILGCGVTFLGLARAQEGFPGGETFEEFPDSGFNATNPLDELRRAADESYQQGKYDQTIELTTQMIQANGQEPYPWYLRASAKVEVGRAMRKVATIREGIADAREGLRLAGRRYPFLYVPYLYGLTALADVEQKPKHADMAIDVVTPVLQQEGVPARDLSQLYFQRGLAYLAKEDFEKAAADFGQAKDRQADFMTAYLNLAQAWISAGKPEEARQVFAETARRFADSPLVYNNRGTFFQQQGELPAAEADFTKAIRLQPQFGMAYVNRGFVRAAQGNYAAAEGDYLAAINISEQPGALQFLGNARMAQGKLTAAVKDYSRALELVPDFAEAYADRGCVKFFQRDYAGAFADFKKALELRPDLTPLHVWCYESGVLAEQKEEAEKLLTAALADPKFVDPWDRKMCEYVAGKITADELLQAAEDPDATVRATRLVTANYFLAVQKAAAGDAAGATENYRASVATKSHGYASYRGARLALGELKAK